MRVKRILGILLVVCMIIPMMCFSTDAYSVCDLNGDGKINSIDAIMMRQLYVGSYSLTSGTKRADVNGDNKVNAVDLSMLALYIVGKLDITKAVDGDFYPVGDGSDKYEQYLKVRLESTNEDVVLGIGDNELYGMDFTDFEDDGYIIKKNGTEVVIFGKTSEGLGNGSRYYANAVENEKTIETVTTYKGVGSELNQIFTFWLDWSSFWRNNSDHVEEIRKPDGTVPSWDWVEAIEAGQTIIHPFMLPKDENGKYIQWLPNTKDLQTMCDSLSWEIGKTHDEGIKLIAYIADIQFFESEAKKMGYSLEDVAAIKDGEYRYDEFYNTYLACINSPQWREWMREALRIYAEAGFDGTQYDYNVFGRNGNYCECDRCQESWKNYCIEKMGTAYPMCDMNTSSVAYKWYCRWKVQMVTDFFEETLSDARKINPDFEFSMNENVLNYMFSAVCLSCEDLYTMCSTEYHGVDIGTHSSLFMFKLADALGYTETVGNFNDAAQFTPYIRLAISTSEAFAAGGAQNYFPDIEYSRQFFAFMKKYPELFQKSENLANVAVLYSADSALCSRDGNDSAVYVGKYLGYSSVLFDYIVLEKEDALEKLEGYDVYIVPDFKSLEADTWGAALEKVLKSGKQVIVIGPSTKRFVNKFAEGATSTVINIPSFITLTETVRETNAYGTLRCEDAISGKNGMEFTVRRPSEKYDVIHAIRFLLEHDETTEDKTEIEYTIPEGKTVDYVSAYCPYRNSVEEYNVDLDWHVENGILYLTTGQFDVHCVIKVEYK